jgi:hypothetical protein
MCALFLLNVRAALLTLEGEETNDFSNNAKNKEQ